ncbi:MAG: arginine--tRNA ligase [Candidatus Andersenbacteria bacterium RIFCSPHIGHO2_12_FULL_46_9]|nr:MAG: arginine--tRNA ligase [Candidatus Andersenbacteria bacterium RIFCSPHIGHO2_12_FULL_46_9]
MTARLNNLIQDNVCDTVKAGEGKSVNLEFISANPTGPLTLGNVRSAFSVDTLGKVLECAGFNVTREYYFNDTGAQVKKLGESVVRRVLQQKGETVDYGDELYQGDYINELGREIAEGLKENENKELFQADLVDSQMIERVGGLAATRLTADIKKMIAEDMRIEFDVWTSEDDLRQKGKVAAVIEKLKASDKVYKKDGAWYLKTTAYGDSEDRVVIKSDGEYAYIAPDIAYHQDKYDRGFDEIFTFVGADHQGHLPKVKAAMEALGNDVTKLHQITCQWMRMTKDGQQVKLSKRLGQIVTPKDLIDEVGYDAMRFFMVQHALNTHMDFDIGIAKERSERNPVYYVQYAYVRLQSILRQAKERGVINEVGEVFELSNSPALTHVQELNLIRQLYRLPEVIAGVAERFEVHDLPYFAMELAKAIHVFYKHVPVLAGENQELIKNRLQLVLAAREVMGKTLDLIGVSKPDVM